MAAAEELSFAVVVPFYNEEAGAEACVRAVCGVLRQVRARSVLIAVNDGSRDATGRILRGLEPDWPELQVLEHGANRGYGAALRTGVRAAAEGGYRYVLFMDSDLTNHPSDIPRFVDVMRRGVDVIKATRYSKGGRVVGVPGWRVWISRAGNAVARVLIGLPLADATNGFRAVKTDLLVRMEPVEQRFQIIVEELYYCRYLARTFEELPVTLTDRSAGQRPTSFLYHPKVFWDYLKYPLKAFLGMRPKL